MTRSLPPGFLIGCATAAHQVEGGGIDNDWSHWERRQSSPIADGSNASRAIEHYSRFRDDIGQLASAGHDAYRFSVEWARVEPRPGMFDRDALRHYVDVARCCRANGLEPVVTLHHFTLPAWLAERGGLRAADAPARFARFAAACAAALCADVGWWLTINEPTVVAVQGYLMGIWPPGMRSLQATFQALDGLLRMHAAGARAVHETARACGAHVRVSMAHHERMLRPRNGVADRVAAILPNALFNRWFLRSCLSGRSLPPIGSGRTVPDLRGSLDYLGVNYYTEDTVTLDLHAPLTLLARVQADTTLPLSDFGWAINPAGLRHALTTLWRLTALPLLVTENGIADATDAQRPSYVVNHLNSVLDAVDEGADVRGYLHWTAWDNFEWAEGYTKHFGLWSVDRETMERRARTSAEVFSRICRTREVPAAAS